MAVQYNLQQVAEQAMYSVASIAVTLASVRAAMAAMGTGVVKAPAKEPAKKPEGIKMR